MISFGVLLAAPLPQQYTRSVWVIPTRPSAGAHFATFPPELVRPCILAGSPPPRGESRATVLDPFAGSGTTGLVAEQEGRDSILVELSPAYVQLQRERTAKLPLPAA